MAQKRRLKTKRVGFRKDASFSKCPSCKQYNTLRRSKTRNIFETIVKGGTWFKVYRCSNCGWRGYKSTFVLTRDNLKMLGIYIIIAFATGFAVKFIIQKFIR
ncbi:MAG: hypothetical protein LC102_10330 [Ignavibacteriales bacterium]|nr:MAG: hypothetical protein F9K26_12010 [Ignavibacteriaceae bacterium]MBW7873581.1 hypothetical protein [Ignavibacteria bacterium]MBZ0197001.1 hypothetical protein [Ignavibacteriaceae bacterium]MCZ2143812.1 hypothetical protein [Ignavibacteriales bacterium]WKZ72763.1 MAG: hypothetical protein QY308_00860 [Ignavibacteriaceae bacterium]